MNVEISGNLRGPTVIFIAGWPDSSDVYRANLMAHLSKDYRIVGITLPGYADASPFMRAYVEGFEEARRAEAQLTHARRVREQQRRRQRTHRGSTWWTRSVAAVRQGLLSLVPRRSGGEGSWATAARTVFGLTVAAANDSASEDDFAVDEAAADLVCYQLANRDSPVRTPLFGYGFHDLACLLEIAVDAAMEWYNDCPSAFLATSVVDPDVTVQGLPAHQLPPHYPRPVLIAHGWGVALAFELLLSRPGYFSRIVALDSGAAAVDRVSGGGGLSGGSGEAGAPTASPSSPHTPYTAAAHPAACAHEPRRSSSAGPNGSAAVVSPSKPNVPAGESYEDRLARDGTPDRRRSLALRYAIRPRKTNAGNTTNVRNLWQRLCIFAYQLLIIACTFTMPRFLARWVLLSILWVAGRPRYPTNPRLVLTAENENFNQQLYRHGCYAARHAEERRTHHSHHAGRSSLPSECLDARVGGYDSDGGGSSSVSTGVPNFRVPSNDDWYIVLIPFLRSESAGQESSAGNGSVEGVTITGGGQARARRGSSSLGLDPPGKAIDVGFTLADCAPAAGAVRAGRPAAATGVSPYHAYRDNVHALYDSALPSVALAAGGAPHRAAGGLWEMHGVPDYSGARGRIQWRPKQIYYRAFLLPPTGRVDSGDDETATSTVVAGSTQAEPRRGRRRRCRQTAAEVQSTMGWIYLQFWWGVVLAFLFSPSWRGAPVEGRTAAATAVGGRQPSSGLSSSPASAVCPEAYSPLVSQRYPLPVRVPILFMYGGSKPFMLHSAQWCEYVRQERRAQDGVSDVVEIQGGGHWFFAEKKYQKKVAERVAEFIVAKANQ